MLGLDVGSKRIGVAISDGLSLCAHALCTLQRRGTKIDATHIWQLCQKHSILQVVLGLPLDCEGNEGHRAQRVRVLGDALSGQGLSVHYCDESFSTVEAEEILISAHVSRKRRQDVIDQLSAAVILQRFLDEASSQEILQKREQIQ